MPVPLSLPEPRNEPLKRSPLRLVVCQVRHDEIAAVADPSRALAIHEALGSEFPQVEETFEETINVASGPAGIATKRTEPRRGWRFRSQDEQWTATLAHSYFAIETSSYDRWAGFKEHLRKLASAVDEVLSPKIEHRLGLRMVDEIYHPDAHDPAGFRGLIRDELLGPIATGDLSASIRSTQNLVEMEGPDGATVNFRHGFQVSDGSAAYLLDHDCFRQGGRAFEVNEILNESERLHTVAKQVFEAAITEPLYEYLHGDAD